MSRRVLFVALRAGEHAQHTSTGRMIRLTGVATTLVLLAGCSGTSHPSDAARHHHYYLVGKRTCRHLFKTTGSTATVYALNMADFPQKYREDVEAGCRADQP